MTISSVLAQAALRGIAIEVRSGRLVCRPASALTPELLTALKGIKSELLLLLPDRGANLQPQGPRHPLNPSYWEALDVETAPLTPVVANSTTCRACRGTRWWRRAGSHTEWFCSTCHPPLVREIEVRDA